MSNKRLYFKKIISIILAACFVFGLCGCLSSCKDGKEVKTNSPLYDNKFVYTSFGDSIAAGYMVNGDTVDGKLKDGCYAKLLSDALHADKTYDLAVTGDDTFDFLKLLKQDKVQKAIKESDLITFALGSNDILGYALKRLYSDFGAYDEESVRNNLMKNGILEAVPILKELNSEFSSDEVANDFEACVESYKKNISEIINQVSTLNPDAVVVMINYYNPYYDLSEQIKKFTEFCLGDVANNYLDKMNKFLSENELRKKYLICDISMLDGSKTNVKLSPLNPSASSFDPHPNVMGHEFIFDKLKETLKKNKIIAKRFEKQ